MQLNALDPRFRVDDMRKNMEGHFCSESGNPNWNVFGKRNTVDYSCDVMFITS